MMDFLIHVGKKGRIEFKAKSDRRKVFFWADENVLFLEPEAGVVKAQGRLIRRAINGLVRD